jgi:hypothetical protein
MEQESSSDTPIIALRAAEIDSVAGEPLLARTLLASASPTISLTYKSTRP